MATRVCESAGGRMVEALRRPEAYPPPPPTRVALVTTHISWVFLTDHDVWKLKRPVDYGFLDYTTLERRRHACEEEARLNQRLAPGVYLGVVPVRLGPTGHTLAGDGPVVDYAVHMRRLPDTASADALLRSGALGHDHLWTVAGVLARFYAAAAPTPRYGSVAEIGANVAENFEQTRPFVGRFLDAATFDTVRAWQDGFLARHPERFAARVERGRIREGHGDL